MVLVRMLFRLIIIVVCLSAAFAIPLPTADACKHCLFFHPFQKDNIAFCQAQNACPIHDDAAASDILLKVDPPTVPFNTSLSTIGGLLFSLISALGLRSSSLQACQHFTLERLNVLL